MTFSCFFLGQKMCFGRRRPRMVPLEGTRPRRQADFRPPGGGPGGPKILGPIRVILRPEFTEIPISSKVFNPRDPPTFKKIGPKMAIFDDF